MNRKPLTTAEVAALLGIDRRTVGWRVRHGKMTPLHQLPGNGAYLFDPDVIDQLAREGVNQ